MVNGYVRTPSRLRELENARVPVKDRGQSSLLEAVDDFAVRPTRMNADDLLTEGGFGEQLLEHTDLRFESRP
jgi:hypothetical protein